MSESRTFLVILYAQFSSQYLALLLVQHMNTHIATIKQGIHEPFKELTFIFQAIHLEVQCSVSAVMAILINDTIIS